MALLGATVSVYAESASATMVSMVISASAACKDAPKTITEFVEVCILGSAKYR